MTTTGRRRSACPMTTLAMVRYSFVCVWRRAPSTLPPPGFISPSHGQPCYSSTGCPPQLKLTLRCPLPGCYNIYGHSNPCWTATSMSSCCGHGRCSGQYDRYNSHCTCNSGWTGSRCGTATAPPPAPPPSPPPASGGSNSCRYAYDNECDDGSQGGTQYCAVGEWGNPNVLPVRLFAGVVID